MGREVEPGAGAETGWVRSRAWGAGRQVRICSAARLEAHPVCASTHPSLPAPPPAGGYSWGLGPVPPLSPAPSSGSDSPDGPWEDEAQQTAARIAGALGGLLTPLFLRGVLAFLIWWTAACQLLSSLFGLYFHQHLAGS